MSYFRVIFNRCHIEESRARSTSDQCCFISFVDLHGVGVCCLYSLYSFDIAAVMNLQFGLVTFVILANGGNYWTFYNHSHMLRGDDGQGFGLADVISIS